MQLPFVGSMALHWIPTYLDTSLIFVTCPMHLGVGGKMTRLSARSLLLQINSGFINSQAGKQDDSVFVVFS